VFRQVFVDLGDDLAQQRVRERVTRLGQRPGRRHDHERADVTRVIAGAECGCHALGEAVFGDLVPIGLLYAAASAAEMFDGAPGPVATDLRRGGVCLVNEHRGRLQIGERLVAFVAQNKRLAPIADEDPSMMGKGNICHGRGSAVFDRISLT